ncbi:hypothetical protein ACJX0J_034661, partial [Zea mays]
RDKANYTFILAALHPGNQSKSTYVLLLEVFSVNIMRTGDFLFHVLNLTDDSLIIMKKNIYASFFFLFVNKKHTTCINFYSMAIFLYGKISHSILHNILFTIELILNKMQTLLFPIKTKEELGNPIAQATHLLNGVFLSSSGYLYMYNVNIPLRMWSILAHATFFPAYFSFGVWKMLLMFHLAISCPGYAISGFIWIIYVECEFSIKVWLPILLLMDVIAWATQEILLVEGGAVNDNPHKFFRYISIDLIFTDPLNRHHNCHMC